MMDTHKHLSRQNPTKLRAMTYMIIAMVCFACMSNAIHAVQDMHVTQMVMVRNFLSFLFMSGWIFFSHRGFAVIKTTRLHQHATRSFVGVVGMHFFFYSMIALPINTAIALNFTAPIFATILAVIFLGERVGIRRVSAIAISFIGVIIIIQPGTHAFNLATIIALAAAAMIGITSTMIKSLTNTEHPDAIIYYMTIFMMLFAAPLGIYFWQPMDGEQWLQILLITAFSMGAHMFMTRAFQMAPLVTLLPLDYTRMVFTVLLAYVFFDEVMTLQTMAGAAVIMSSSFYVARREMLKSRKP